MLAFPAEAGVQILSNPIILCNLDEIYWIFPSSFIWQSTWLRLSFTEDKEDSGLSWKRSETLPSLDFNIGEKACACMNIDALRLYKVVVRCPM